MAWKKVLSTTAAARRVSSIRLVTATVGILSSNAIHWLFPVTLHDMFLSPFYWYSRCCHVILLCHVYKVPVIKKRAVVYSIGVNEEHNDCFQKWIERSISYHYGFKYAHRWNDIYMTTSQKAGRLCQQMCAWFDKSKWRLSFRRLIGLE